MGARLIRPSPVLVATDFSEGSAAAMVRAAQVAQARGDEIVAVHVMLPETDMADVEDAHSRLERCIAAQGVSCPSRTIVRRGVPAPEITAEARDRDAWLIVLGVPGGGWLGELRPGGTVEDILRTAQFPTLVVKGPAQAPYRSVLLAEDLSEESSRAAQVGSALSPGAEHVLAHVCTVIGEPLLRTRGATEVEIGQLRQSSTRPHRERIARIAATLRPPPDAVIVTPGHPPSRLLELAESSDADLIAVGTGARSPMAYALLGSVAQHILRHSDADVLVVPARAH